MPLKHGDDDSSDDDKPYVRRPEVLRPAARARNLNEALALALANGFPGDTDIDKLVTEEELKQEEDAAKTDMEIAEKKANEILEGIKSEAKALGGKTDASTSAKASAIESKEVRGTIDEDDDDDDDGDSLVMQQREFDSTLGSILERARFIPLRLSYEG